MTDQTQATLRTALQQAIKTLEAVEWTPDADIWSPVCYWCRGYKRNPAMDQDYGATAGHKTNCQRQQALSSLRALLTAHPEAPVAEALPCPHGRSHWGHCPHCQGLNTPAPEAPVTTPTIPIPAVLPPGATVNGRLVEASVEARTCAGCNVHKRRIEGAYQ